MHVSRSDLRRYATAQIHGHDLLTIDAHLLECAECVAGLVEEYQPVESAPAIILERLEQERRSGRAVELQVLHPFSTTRIPAGIIDVSEGQAKLMVHTEVNPQALVRISFQELVLLGSVEYYDVVEDVYYLTVRLTREGDHATS